MADEALPRAERLRGRERIDELFARGTLGTARLATARMLPNDLSCSRLAAVTGRACGNAVARNRLRRRLRAAFRTQKAVLPSGFDVAVLPRRGALEASWPEFAASVRQAVERARTGAVPPPRPKRGGKNKLIVDSFRGVSR